MNVFFRADASINIGTGHVMRCLTLADELRQWGANVSFVCREEPGNLVGLIEEKNYIVHRLRAGIDTETDRELTSNILAKVSPMPDWLIEDHYGIDASWESSMRNHTRKIMVIDDTANRRHDCDILLDQNYCTDQDRYTGLLPDNCVKLLGPKYAILRAQFRRMREKRYLRNGEIKKILVLMGGTDPDNATCKALRAIQMLKKPAITTDVVVGLTNPNRGKVERLTSRISNAHSHFNVNNMADMMEAADLCIGSGSSTTWERCSAGLASIAVTLSENQFMVNKMLSEEGIVIHSGWYSDVTEKNLADDIDFLIRHKDIVQHMSSKSRNLVDGRGVARVVKRLLDRLPSKIKLSRASMDDCPRLFKWRNHTNVRKHFFGSSPISWDEHERWFANALTSPDIELLVGYDTNKPVGVLRYDLTDYIATVSIYLIPELIGSGFGADMLKTGTGWIKKNYPGIKEIVAKIKPDNELSKKTFNKSGFNEGYMNYVLKLK